MSQLANERGKKIHDVDRRTQNLERRINRMCNSFTSVGLLIAFGSFSFDFIAPLFQIRVAEGMGWQQFITLFLGVLMIFIGLITKGENKTKIKDNDICHWRWSCSNVNSSACKLISNCTNYVRKQRKP